MAASKNSKQMITGKAFEYALLITFKEKLENKTNVEVIDNSAFNVARDCYATVTDNERSEYLLSSSFAVNFLMDIEPRLSNDIGPRDILQLEILSDDHGKKGDVRDVLAIRSVQKWEIGVSAKNNHKAVKHSRLSSTIDFGSKWLGIKSSDTYFKTVRPIFEELRKIKNESNSTKLWSELDDHHSTVYLPILTAFIAEIKNLHKKNPSVVSANLITYLIGTKDFYKVIKSRNLIEIQAYNLRGTLNLPFKKIKPKYKTLQIPLPTKISSIGFKKGSKNTVIVEMDNDWSLSFRIHNASSRVEPSLKFDVNLLKSPSQLFKNKFNIHQ